MPAAVLQPQKRVLGDSTKIHRNVIPSSPGNAAKRRKLDVPIPQTNGLKAPKVANPGSSQPKSQFEEEVLEKLTQDISGLKQKNAEKDQQWERPPLDDFDVKRDSLCFQQIEAEEGALNGKTTVRLFGVTEVLPKDPLTMIQSLMSIAYGRQVTPFFSMSPISSITFMSPLPCNSKNQTARVSKFTSMPTSARAFRLRFTPFKWL